VRLRAVLVLAAAVAAVPAVARAADDALPAAAAADAPASPGEVWAGPGGVLGVWFSEDEFDVVLAERATLNAVRRDLTTERAQAQRDREACQRALEAATAPPGFWARAETQRWVGFGAGVLATLAIVYAGRQVAPHAVDVVR
jgi:hypothetical protein